MNWYLTQNEILLFYRSLVYQQSFFFLISKLLLQKSIMNKVYF